MSSIPDKDRSRPTVPEVEAWLVLYYRLPGCSIGGAVHCITEDPNYEQAVADLCVEEAGAWRRRWASTGDPRVDVQLAVVDQITARLLASMTKTQRRKVASSSYYPPAGSSSGQDTGAFGIGGLREAGSIPAPAMVVEPKDRCSVYSFAAGQESGAARCARPRDPPAAHRFDRGAAERQAVIYERLLKGVAPIADGVLVRDALREVAGEMAALHGQAVVVGSCAEFEERFGRRIWDENLLPAGAWVGPRWWQFRWRWVNWRTRRRIERARIPVE